MSEKFATSESEARASIKNHRQEEEIISPRLDVFGTKAACTDSQLAHQKSLEEEILVALALQNQELEVAKMQAG